MPPEYRVGMPIFALASKREISRVSRLLSWTSVLTVWRSTRGNCGSVPPLGSVIQVWLT
jgi:hypothetical protein